MLTENVESYLKDDKLLLFHQMFLWSVYSPFILSVENLFWKKKIQRAKNWAAVFHDRENHFHDHNDYVANKTGFFQEKLYWTNALI